MGMEEFGEALQQVNALPESNETLLALNLTYQELMQDFITRTENQVNEGEKKNVSTDFEFYFLGSLYFGKLGL